MSIDKSILGVAGELAVASELCRRNVYAQPTFGHQKSMDLLAFVGSSSSSSRLLRIEVKAKQGPEWPNCKGISGEDVFLVFVDFAGKSDTDRPDFYVLTSDEWRELVKAQLERCKQTNPDTKAFVTDDNQLIWPDQVGDSGKCYKGCGVKPQGIQIHKDAWHKITHSVTRGG
jgi:hypothetical protein